MIFKYSVKTAFAGLRSNRFRAFLTILGIVIGITAIIIVMSLGKGAENLIIGQLQGLGSRTIIVLPGRPPTGPSDASQIFSDSLKQRDVEAIARKADVPGAGIVTPMNFGPVSSSYANETYRTTVLGVSEAIQEIMDVRVEEGTFFNDEDVISRSDVVVLGAKVKEELFGPSQALGQKIKLKDRNFRVVGILPSKGQVSFFNFDDMVLIPHTTAADYILGRKYYDRIAVQALSEDLLEQTVQDIEITLRNLHNITDPEKDDFHVETQQDLVAIVSTITGVLTLFLFAVAAISLIVGGIGIMNIMLVSVAERTREIGLRKALGATNKDILTQFLIESVVLTLTGGVIGIILGFFLSLAAASAITRVGGFDWQFTFPFVSALVGMGVSGFIGLVFGLYPARQASRKSPIEALRYE